MTMQLNYWHFALKVWCMGPYSMKLGNESEYQFFVRKICHSFCVQIAKFAKVINTDTSSITCFSIITLNWKLSTGGSFLMLNLLLASCEKRPEVN
jgi:hypothetical protein